MAWCLAKHVIVFPDQNSANHAWLVTNLLLKLQPPHDEGGRIPSIREGEMFKVLNRNNLDIYNKVSRETRVSRESWRGTNLTVRGCHVVESDVNQENNKMAAWAE
jgi:hypothetical protein